MQTPVLNDEALVLQYMNGNEQSLEILIRRHKSKVFTSIFMFVRDQYLAEDLFQDTFIKVVKKLRARQYQEEGKFLPWVMRISHNLCIDFTGRPSVLHRSLLPRALIFSMYSSLRIRILKRWLSGSNLMKGCVRWSIIFPLSKKRW
jgi:RNA polymerase sigma factor (sigma-70 family)